MNKEEIKLLPFAEQGPVLMNTANDILNNSIMNLMGFEIVISDKPSPFGIEDRPYWNNFKNPREGCYVDEWEPTEPESVSGKEQAFDLMFKYKLNISWNNENNAAVITSQNSKFFVKFRETEQQKAIVVACIMIELEKLK